MSLPLLALGLMSLTLQGPATEKFAKAAVASDHVLASEAGVEVLKAGGNAVDAAVATGFALAVTFPAAGNLGGGGFLVFRSATGESMTVDYRETAPALATRNMFLDGVGKLTDRSVLGHLASGIPGTPAGLWAAHKHWGKIRWKQCLAPAIRLARKGFQLNHELATEFAGLAEEGRKKGFLETYRVFGRSGNPYRAGDLFKQPELAETLQRIADLGPDGFYKGRTAELLVAEMKRGSGLISAEDLANYKPVFREPLTGKFLDYEVVTMPPPSSGGIILLQMLGMIEPEKLRSEGFGSSGAIHSMVEVMKRCFADRAVWMADPDFFPVPVEKLLDPAYLRQRRANISDRATPSADIQTGLPTSAEHEETTHFSIVDSEGNAVSNTYTLNGGYGSKVTVTGAGFLLNNEMDDFSAKPGTPNMFGLVQGEQNAIQPGKRPLSSMTPTLLVKEGKIALVVGSPGGPTIINTVFETIVNRTLFGLSAQSSVSAPRFHHQWLPDEISIEALGLSKDVATALQSRGHKLRTRTAQGSCHLIVVEPQTGLRAVGCDRRQSTAGLAGY